MIKNEYSEEMHDTHLLSERKIVTPVIPKKKLPGIRYVYKQIISKITTTYDVNHKVS